VLTRDDLRADAEGGWLDALRAQLFEPTPWPRG
jgi:hypothetical protein